MIGRPRFRTGEIELARLAAEDREPAWRQTAAPHYEVSDLPTEFLASGRLVQLGGLSFTDSVHPQQVFTRTRSRVRRDGVDQIFCSLEMSPGSQKVCDDKAYDLQVGAVLVTDLTRPSMKIGAPGRTLCLAIERDALLSLLPGADHLDDLMGPMGAFFAEHLQMLARARPHITADMAPHLEQATLAMLAACLKPSVATFEQAAPALAGVTLQRAQRIIDMQMHDPDFGPADLTRLLAMSRTRLYRLFEPSGGIAALIRERRLLRAQSLLGAPVAGRRVQDVAFAAGFRSVSQFSRAYRARFGLAPSDVRQTGMENRSARG